MAILVLGFPLRYFKMVAVRRLSLQSHHEGQILSQDSTLGNIIQVSYKFIEMSSIRKDLKIKANLKNFCLGKEGH